MYTSATSRHPPNSCSRSCPSQRYQPFRHPQSASSNAHCPRWTGESACRVVPVGRFPMKSRLSKSSVFHTVRLSLSLPLLPRVDLPFACRGLQICVSAAPRGQCPSCSPHGSPGASRSSDAPPRSAAQSAHAAPVWAGPVHRAEVSRFTLPDRPVCRNARTAKSRSTFVWQRGMASLPRPRESARHHEAWDGSKKQIGWSNPLEAGLG